MLNLQSFSISKGLLFLLFFILSLFFDTRKQKIPALLFLLFLGFFLLHGLLFWKVYQSSFASLPLSEVPYLCFPLLLSLFLLLLSKWSKEAIGYGDSLFLLLASFYCSFYHFFFLFSTAMLFACFLSMILFLYCKKKKKNPKNCRFPFLPCFLPGMLYLLFVSLL